MRKYVIMGVQGSGKGTQATMLAEDLDLVHISVGDIFRWNVQHHTKIGAQVRRTMAGGELVGDDLVEGIVKARLAEHDWNFGFIIDGFPRNERQAEFFLESYDIDGVIHLDMPDSEVRRRVMARRLCSGCGMDYNLLASSPTVGGRCDVCGGELVTREDDTEEALAVRLRDYHQKTNPVLDIFRRKEYVVTVDARPAKEEVQQAVRAKLGLPPALRDAGLSRVRVLFAPDSFKGSITAAAAAAALARGWRRARPGDRTECLPLADGGEGTLDMLAAAVPGARRYGATVTGPGGAPAGAQWLELPGGAAVIELAQGSGLPLLDPLDPLGAQTTGTGELIGLALDHGATAISLAIGGSASTDGGTGALAALGARFLDASGTALPGGGGALRRLAEVDLAGLRPPPPGGVTCLTDVTAPLLGAGGAAAAFGPQKGASPAQVAELEEGLARLAGLLGGDAGAPGAGAAGGTGYGFAAAWGAVIVPGAAELGRIAGLPAAVAGADLVVTGEGRFDVTSTTGKVTGSVLAEAAAAGVASAVVAGSLAADLPQGCVAGLSLSELAGGAAAAQAGAAHWLEEAGAALAAAWAGTIGG